jgi:hypothetical protein
MLPHTVLFRLAFTVRVAIRTPRVSGTGYAHCISRGFTFLSNCTCEYYARLVAPSLAIPLRARLSPGRSVGGPTDAPTAGKRPVPTRPGTRVAVFPSVKGGRSWRPGSSARCARTAPDSPFRVVSACDNNAYRLINAPQSLKPKGFSVIFDDQVKGSINLGN